jgi:hypothetical protein
MLWRWRCSRGGLMKRLQLAFFLLWVWAEPDALFLVFHGDSLFIFLFCQNQTEPVFSTYYYYFPIFWV